jgi:hypothetical protein
MRVLRAIWKWLLRLFNSDRAVAFRFVVTIGDVSVYLDGDSMALLLTDIQKATLTVVAVDAKGFPTTKFTGTPAWTISDPTVGVVVPAVDGLTAVLSAGDPGLAQVKAAAGPVEGTLDIDVEPSDAVTLSIVAGAPEAQ